MDLANRDQALHAIFNDILKDETVPAHGVVMEAMRRAYALAESKQELVRMVQQNNLAAQMPMDVRCKCGWQGKSDKLLSNMGTGELLCPGCTAKFAPYPVPKIKAPPDTP